MTRRRLSWLGAAAALIAAALVLDLQPWRPSAQIAQEEGRFAGLEWTFVRARYTSWNSDGFRGRYGSDPWAIDGPAAEQNLSRRLRSVTAIQVNEPIALSLEDPELFKHPWLYFVEPGNLSLSDTEAPILREFLLRGGTAVFDDFHGPIEWAHLVEQLQKVFPDRRVVQLPPEHPIFHCFYTIEAYPQIPGLGSFFRGRTWEKGGFAAGLYAILDDTGRPMALINWNTDMGDGWEWSSAEEYPGYIRHTAEAYRMMINEIIYSLTH